MLYEVITEYAIEDDSALLDAAKADPEVSAYAVRIAQTGLRITSYNVCYTKLLRNIQNIQNIGVSSSIFNFKPEW